jgi:phage FluMu protein Com
MSKFNNIKLTKQCKRCKEVKELENFHYTRGNFLALCTPCLRERQRGYYVNRRIDIKEWLFDYLSQNPCIDCGETDPIRLEFDHRGDKKFVIGKSLIGKSKSLADVQAEVAKCDVRCANCHKVKTHSEQNTWKHRMHLERKQNV